MVLALPHPERSEGARTAGGSRVRSEGISSWPASAVGLISYSLGDALLLQLGAGVQQGEGCITMAGSAPRPLPLPRGPRQL